MSLVLISGAAISITGRASVTLDTRGANVIYIFGYAVFDVDATPPDGFDSEGNTWAGIGNPFSSCSGSMASERCFNPITSATHNFRVVGPKGRTGEGVDFTVQIIVVAMKTTINLTDPLIQRRAASGQVAPARPGSFSDTVDNFAMITACQAGCGLTDPSVDSGFIIEQSLPNLVVATATLLVAGTVNVAWSGFTPSLGAPGGIGTAGVLIEGFGIYIPPSSSGVGTRIYEA
jgi:hypothetical protein